MAKIVSPVWSSIRGSIAGITYFPNQYGAIIARQKVTPVDPSTVRQNQARDAVAEAVENWKLIAQSNRDGWNWYALNTIMQGPQGNFRIPGREHYVRSYSAYEYLLTRGFLQPAWVANAPSTLGLPEVGPVVARPLTAPGTGFELAFTNMNPEFVYMYGSVAGPFGLTRNRYKGPYLTETLDRTIAVDTFLTGTLPFPNLTVDTVYFWKVRIIGALGSGVRLSTISRGRVITTETVLAGDQPAESSGSNKK